MYKKKFANTMATVNLQARLRGRSYTYMYHFEREDNNFNNSIRIYRNSILLFKRDFLIYNR